MVTLALEDETEEEMNVVESGSDMGEGAGVADTAGRYTWQTQRCHFYFFFYLREETEKKKIKKNEFHSIE